MPADYPLSENSPVDVVRRTDTSTQRAHVGDKKRLWCPTRRSSLYQERCPARRATPFPHHPMIGVYVTVLLAISGTEKMCTSIVKGRKTSCRRPQIRSAPEEFRRTIPLGATATAAQASQCHLFLPPHQAQSSKPLNPPPIPLTTYVPVSFFVPAVEWHAVGLDHFPCFSRQTI